MAAGQDDIGALLALPKEIASAVGDALAQFSMGSVVPRMDKALAPVTALVGSFTKTLTGLLDPFKKIQELADHFVNDLDPALVQNLSERFRDLNAVLGVALRPITDLARDVVKSLSDHLLPVMKKLEPLVRQISELVASELIQGFNDLGNRLEEMMPLFEGLKDFVAGILPIMHDIADLMGVARQVFQALIAELLGLVGIGGGGGGGGIGGVKQAMEQLRKVVDGVIISIVQFTAMMFQLLGWMKGLEAMRKALEPGGKKAAMDDSTGTAIALNPMFKAIGDLGKSVQAAMFAASDQPGGAKVGVERSNELLEGLDKAIMAGVKQGEANQDKFDGYVTQIKTEIGLLPEKIKTKANELLPGLKGMLDGAVDHGMGVISNKIDMRILRAENRLMTALGFGTE